MKSIVVLNMKSKLPKWTENEVAQSSRDVKNFGYIVKDLKISARKMREFHMKQDCLVVRNVCLDLSLKEL